MIGRIKGKLVGKEEGKAFIHVSGLTYEVNIPKTVHSKIEDKLHQEIELVVYYYFHMDHSRGLPVMIGFVEELERDFFEKFISVSGIGPRAALRAFDRPVSLIAQAIEEGDVNSLKGLAGIGAQRAKQIVASLQGKVGRFVLIKEEARPRQPHNREIIEEARQILKRLQYSSKEIEGMIKKALEANPQLETVEELLNEIYRQRKYS